MTVTVGRVSFRNPVLVGSCDLTVPHAATIERWAHAGFGGVVLKSVTDATSLQDPAITKTYWLPDGSLLSIGGPMLAADAAAAAIAETVQAVGVPDFGIVGSVCATAGLAAWARLVLAVAQPGVVAVELNLGNPHVPEPLSPLAVVEHVRRVSSVPLWVKLPRHLCEDVALAARLRDGGADALVVGHRPRGWVRGPDGRPLLPDPGGYSGPWLKPMTLAALQRLHRVGIPLVANGGLWSETDVTDALHAGANAVEMVSALLQSDPDRPPSRGPQQERLGRLLAPGSCGEG
jgi:dihydroorotate dehydrogenase